MQIEKEPVQAATIAQNHGAKKRRIERRQQRPRDALEQRHVLGFVEVFGPLEHEFKAQREG